MADDNGLEPGQDTHAHEAETTADLIHLPCRPNETDMTEMVNALFRYSMHGRVELAWTDPHRVGKRYPLSHAELFELSDLEGLVARALEVGAIANQNVYVSAGLRKPDAPSGRGSADSVLALAALKADCDSPGCLTHALEVCEELGIRPSFAVLTGRQPHLRGSLWWVLEEPEQDFDRTSRLEKRLAALFGSDGQVINRDRVMRLAGSVAWPMKADRVLEMTGVYRVPWRAAPYTLNELARAVGEPAASSASAEAPASSLDLSTARATHNIAALIRAAAEPSKWHESARDLTAHLIGKGCPPDVALELLTPVLTQPGYSYGDTRADLAVLLGGAARKGWAPEAAPIPDLGENPFVTIEDMLSRPPPEWIVDGYLTEGGLSVLWGASGAFKSFVALDLSLSVAHGVDWHGRPVRRGPVLYICAEGQYGFGLRAHVWRAHRAPDPGACAGFRVLPVPVNFLEPAVIDRLLEAAVKNAVDASLIVVDTLARNFGPGDENSTQDMNKFVTGATRLGAEMGAHVMLVHHTGKDDTKGERGAYSLRGAVDTSLKLVRDGKSERIALEHFKQKDGPELEMLPLRVVSVETPHPLTGEIVGSLVPVLDATPRAEDGASPQLSKPQQRALALVESGSGNLATLAARSGVDKSNLRRTLNELIGLRLLSLTESGTYFSRTTEIPQEFQDDE